MVFLLGPSFTGNLADAVASVPQKQRVNSTQQKYEPGIMFATLLNNVAVNARGGWFKLGNQMQNVFMPDGSTGHAVLSYDGNEFCHWKWTLDTFGLRPPYKLFSFQQPILPNGKDMEYADMKLTRGGNYTLDFYIGANKFYSFPFRVRPVEPSDAFSGETLYFTDGAWNDWGYLMYPNADPEQNILWKIWMRETSFDRVSHKVKVEVFRDSNNKLICQSREGMSHSFQNNWKRIEFDLINPPVKTSGGEYFKAKDLLAVDGPYTLKMTMDGKEYGRWKFTVANGKIQYSGRTERGKADRMSFIEGGRDAWWLERVK